MNVIRLLDIEWLKKIMPDRRGDFRTTQKKKSRPGVLTDV